MIVGDGALNTAALNLYGCTIPFAVTMPSAVDLALGNMQVRRRMAASMPTAAGMTGRVKVSRPLATVMATDSSMTSALSVLRQLAADVNTLSDMAARLVMLRESPLYREIVELSSAITRQVDALSGIVCQIEMVSAVDLQDSLGARGEVDE